MNTSVELQEKHDHGNVDTAAPREVLDMQPEELWENELMDVNENVVVMKMLKMSQRKLCQQKISH